MCQTTVVEKVKTHFVFNNFFFNRAFYEIMWNKVGEPDRSQMAIRRMRIAYGIPKATNTHSRYAILTALQQRLHEHT
jgi:hypothetical protein